MSRVQPKKQKKETDLIHLSTLFPLSSSVFFPTFRKLKDVVFSQSGRKKKRKDRPWPDTLGPPAAAPFLLLLSGS